VNIELERRTLGKPYFARAAVLPGASCRDHPARGVARR